MTRCNTLRSICFTTGLAALFAGCADDPGFAWVDMDAMTPPGAVMTFSQLVAEPLEQMEFPVASDSWDGPPPVDSGSVVVDAQEAAGEPGFAGSPSGMPLPPSFQGMDQDEDAVSRRYQLAWAQVGVGEVFVTGQMELVGGDSGGSADAAVTIGLGPEQSELDLYGSWAPVGGGVSIDMAGSFIDPEGVYWRTEARRLEIADGCAGVTSGSWTAHSHAPDGSDLSFEIQYEDGCTGCAELFIDGTSVGTSCLGS